MTRINKSGLQVSTDLASFIDDKALVGTGVDSAAFWDGFSKLVHDLAPKNAALLAKRASIQTRIDDWHRARAGQPHDATAYKSFLTDIGYLFPEGPDFTLETQGVDPEIAEVPGPQLVVPITNARYALNAANARWGNLYDALYGTDAIGDLPSGKGYDTARGQRVIDWGKGFLDQVLPLTQGSWKHVTDLKIEYDRPVLRKGADVVEIADPSAYQGWVETDGTI
ncbi:MAG: malate synthase G, partial [Jannaschia helgolandensis]